MRKTFLLGLAFVAALAAKADNIVLPGTAKAILTMKAEVGAEVSLTLGVYDDYDIFAVDFGDGVQKIDSVGHENKGVCLDGAQKPGTTHTGATKFTGTVAGDGTITVYGTSDIWYLLASGGAMPTSFDQAKLMNVVQMSITGADVESVVLPAYEKMTQFNFNNSSVKSVDVSKVTGLTSLTINNTTASKLEPQLESIDVSKNAELTYLSLQANQNNYGLLKTLDLTANTKLEGVYATYNQLTEVKLADSYDKLTIINLQNNQLTAFDATKTLALKSLYLADNKLATIDVSGCANLAWFDVKNNQLTGDLDLTANLKFTNVYVNNNKLTSVKVTDVTKQFYVDGNLMTLATLPAQPASMNTTSKTKQFHYAPQAAFEVTGLLLPNDELDLTSQLTVAKGELNADGYATWLEGTTTYSFATAGGTALVEGTDYEVVEPGKFKLLKAQAERIHAVMLNSAFPKFTAEVPFVSTDVTVASTPILTLKAAAGNEVSLTFGVYDSEDTFGVDFGDGDVKMAKVGIDNKGPVKADGTTGSATKFDGTVAGDGTIKVYGTNDIWYLLASGGAIPTSLDQEKLMNVVQMGITGADVEKVVLPAYEKMTQFSFNNSSVKSVDVSKAIGLTSLTINNTTASKLEPQLESIDLSKNTELAYLSIQANQNNYGKLKKLDLTNNTKLDGMGLYVQYNELTEVKLGENTLTAINVQNNQLTSLDWAKLPKLKSLYAADNQLASIDVSGMENLAWLDVKNNQLTGDLDLTANLKFTNVYVNNNKLTSVKVTDVTKQFYVDGNLMTLATLPAQPASMNTASKTKQFHYAPQAAFEVAEEVGTLDLSGLLTVKKGELNSDGFAAWLEGTTTYSFATAGGTELKENIDYTVTQPGVFKFIKPQTEKVYGVMTNAAFPKFTGANAYKTSEFTVAAYAEVAVGDSYTAFSSTSPLDFSASGITVYTAKRTNNYVVLTKVESGLVPAGEGVILTADNATTYSVPMVAEAAALSGNELVGVTEQTTVAYANGDKYNYILQGGEFKKATGAQLKAGKAYLSTAYDVTKAGEARLLIVDGEATGISTVENVRNATGHSVYDLQGRHIQKPVKGLYIVNGKKMIVK